jgi:MFS family permease
LSEDSALLSGVGVGIVNFVFTLFGMIYIDRFGRRQLLIIGCFGMIVSLSAVAYAFASGMTGLAIPIFFFLFIASFAISSGAVIWVIISEVFPTHLRADGQAWGCGTHWVLAALIPAFIPALIESIGVATVFGFFALMMVAQLIYVWKVLPETKGLSVEELQKVLNR